MPKFMIAYHGGERPSSKEEGQKHMANWKSWIESLGDKVVNSGTPLMDTKIIQGNSIEDQIDPMGMNGFAVIKAESMDDAIAIAKTDPFLNVKGVIKVSQMMQMS